MSTISHSPVRFAGCCPSDAPKAHATAPAFGAQHVKSLDAVNFNKPKFGEGEEADKAVIQTKSAWKKYALPGATIALGAAAFPFIHLFALPIIGAGIWWLIHNKRKGPKV